MTKGRWQEGCEVTQPWLKQSIPEPDQDPYGFNYIERHIDPPGMNGALDRTPSMMTVVLRKNCYKCCCIIADLILVSAIPHPKLESDVL